MAVRESKLIVSLTDKLSGPSRAVSSALGRLNALAAANAKKLQAVRGQMADAIGAGYLLAQGLGAPIKAAAAFESRLEDIGQKADIPQKRLAELGKQLRLIGRQTNQAGSQMAEGMDTLLGLGASESDALGLLPTISKASVAYKASIADLSAAGYAALDNLKVPATEFSRAMDAMATAGKLGAFELKDQAQYLPSLGAGYQGLGQTGVKAVADLSAALQIVRKGTGDSASAATNLGNVLQKIKAPQTIKAFKKMGVNLEKELKKRAEAGMTPIEAIADITSKTLKGDLSKIGDLFSDSQVQQGLRPLIQNMDEYRRIRAEAMKASGTVEADFQRRIKTSEGALLRMQATLENLSASIGSALLPALNSVIDGIAPVVQNIAELAERYPKLTSGIVAATSAVIAFRIALTGLRFAGLFAFGSALSAGIGTLKVLSGVLTGLGAALATVSAPVLLAVGVGIAAIGAAGAYLWAKWDRISSIVKGVARAIGDELKPVIDMLQPVLEPFSKSFQAIGDAAAWAWSQIKEVSSWLGGLFGKEDLTRGHEMAIEDGAYALTQKIIQAFKSANAAIFAAGAEMIQALWDGMVSKVEALIAWVKTIPQRIKAAIGDIDFLGGIKSKLGFGGGEPAVDGARASGGPVRGGGTYLVGERGPELFSPNRSGLITPNHALGGGSGGGGTNTITVAPTFNIYGSQANPQELARLTTVELGSAAKAAVESSFSGGGGF